MNFERGLDPKKAMGTGKYSKPFTKVKCKKNFYSTEYKKLKFTAKHIYIIEYLNQDHEWMMIFDNLNQPYHSMIISKYFNEYFEPIYG